MEKWLKWAIEIQSLAQAGLAYTDNVYDIERYERLREISAEMIEEKSDISLEKVKKLFCNETGYQTPKIDTRAVIFKDNKILLTHENNGTWSLPGGWCDVLETVKTNTIKEVKEETGLDVETIKIISIQDRNKHNKPVYAYGIGIIGDIVFLIAVVTMKDSWRAGIPNEDKTKFISNGIYSISRNPAFLGFDLMYIGIGLIYCNILTIIFTLFAIIMLHFQILQEEKFLEKTFSNEYIDYKKRVRRYC